MDDQNSQAQGKGVPVKTKEGLEPVVLLLFVGILVFTGALFLSERFFGSDGQMFQVVAGLLTGFSGAFFMRVKPREGNSNSSHAPTSPQDNQDSKQSQ